MTLNFVRKNFSIGASNDNISSQLVFYKRGFEINGSRGSIDWQDIIISGNTALTLVNAKADGLNYLKLFGGCEQTAENLTSVTANGKCEQTGTPTPSNPISITCNNGVLKLRLKSSYDPAYNVLKGIRCNGTGAWFGTGINADIDTEIEVEASNITSSTTQIVVAKSPATTFFRIVKAGSSQKIVGSINSTTITSNIDGSARFTAKLNKTGFYINGNLVGSIGATSVSNMGELEVCHADYGGTQYDGSNITFHKVIIRKSGVVVFNGVPRERISDGKIGLYDTVSNTFFSSTGSKEFDSTGLDPIAYEVYADGTTETITDSLGYSATVNNLYSLTNGTNTFTDTQEVLTGAISRNIGVKVFDGTEDWTYQSTNSRFVYDVGLKIVGNRTCPMLCTHYQAITDGRALADVPNYSVYGATSNNSVYLHDSRFTTASALTNYLQEQYSAGTPVILVYPLATPTTESVTGQVLYREPLTVTGSLSDLVVNTTTASATPTPSATIPIICNNGELKVRNKSGLPEGYIKTTYTANSGDTNGKINTGLMPMNGDIIEIEFTAGAPVSFYLFQSRIGSNAIYGITGSGTGATISANWDDATVSSISRTREHHYYIRASFIDGTATIYVKDFTSNQDATNTGTYSTSSTPTVNYFLWGNSSNYLSTPYPTMYVKLTNNGTTRLNYVPCIRKSDNVAGFYDTVSQSFVTTTSTATAGSVDYTDYEVYADGTVETVALTVSLDNVGFTNGYYIQANGNIKSNEGLCYSDLIPVKANKTYVYTATTTARDRGRRLHAYDSSGNWIEQIKTFNPTTNNYSTTFTVGATTAYIRVSTAIAETNRKLKSTGEATAENLLAVGTYKDVQEVLSGAITRKVGIYTITGQENWGYQGTNTNLFSCLTGIEAIYPSTSICTHYKGVVSSTTTSNIQNNDFKYGYTGTLDKIYIRDNAYDNDLAGFKAFLAAQFNAGTPVIIVFPLETATTESVTGQTMNISQGTNVIEITQASIDGLPLEVSYKAGVTVTVEEVENANLDDSVTVTIGE